MKLDKRTVNRLLNMDDRQLENMIRTVAGEAGIDPALLGLDPNNIQAIRQALGSATQEDLNRLTQIYDTYRQDKS